MKYFGIYTIINNQNQKFYIGSTGHLNIRKNQHWCLLRKNKHPNKHLQASWNKYGEKYFSFHIIDECLQSEIVLKEQYWIDVLMPHYNHRKIAHSNFGIKMSHKPWNTKYSQNLIDEIRHNYKNGKTVKELSFMCGISQRYIRSIVENKKWADLNYFPKLSREEFSKKISNKHK